MIEVGGVAVNIAERFGEVGPLSDAAAACPETVDLLKSDDIGILARMTSAIASRFSPQSGEGGALAEAACRAHCRRRDACL